MAWESFWESYNQVNTFVEERIKTLEDLMTIKDKLRELVNVITPIRNVKDSTYRSVGAVDSAYGNLFVDNWGRRFDAVCVSGIGFIPNQFIQKTPEILRDEHILGYEEEDDYRRILKGLAIAKEIHSAKMWFFEMNMDLILIDDAAKSAIISINQAMTTKNLEKSKAGKEMKNIYKETLQALYDMLYMGTLVFIPKESDEVLIANKISSKLNRKIDKDYPLLEVVLDKGEYIIIEPETVLEAQPWNYTLPKVEGITEDFLSKLFNLLRSLKVIYFKSMIGRVVKIETYTPLTVNQVWDFFFLQGENILAYLADRSAKHYFGLLKTHVNEINPWKYRV